MLSIPVFAAIISAATLFIIIVIILIVLISKKGTKRDSVFSSNNDFSDGSVLTKSSFKGEKTSNLNKENHLLKDGSSQGLPNDAQIKKELRNLAALSWFPMPDLREQWAYQNWFKKANNSPRYVQGDSEVVFEAERSIKRVNNLYINDNCTIKEERLSDFDILNKEADAQLVEMGRADARILKLMATLDNNDEMAERGFKTIQKANASQAKLVKNMSRQQVLEMKQMQQESQMALMQKLLNEKQMQQKVYEKNMAQLQLNVNPTLYSKRSPSTPQRDDSSLGYKSSPRFKNREV